MRLRAFAFLLRLGWRLVRVGRGTVLSATTVMVVAASATVLMLGLLAAAKVALAQAERISARTPVGSETVEEGSPGQTVFAHRRVPLAGDIVELIAVAVGEPAPPVPPGLRRWPEPGEVVASPALRELRERDETVRLLLPGSIVGSVSPEGLAAPDERLAWVGVEAGSLPGEVLSGFGGSHGDRDVLTVTAVYGPIALTLFVLVPLAVVIACAARLSARVRERRLLALRVLGLTRGQTVRVAAVETVALSLVGAGLGAAGWPLVHAVMGTGPIAGERFFPQDANQALPTVLAVAVVVVIVAVVVTLVAAGRAAAAEFRARPTLTLAPPRPASLLILGLGCAGLLLTAGPLAATLPPSPTTYLLYLFALLVAIGLAVGLPTLARRCAEVVARRGIPLTLLLALRRLAANPGLPSRIAAPVCALVFAVAAFQPLISEFGGDQAFIDDQTVRQARGGRQLARIEGLAADQADRLRGILGVRQLLPVISVTSEPGTSRLLLATCTQINAIALTHVDRCPKSPWAILTGDDPLPPDELQGVSLALDLEGGGAEILGPVNGALDIGLSVEDNLTGYVVAEPDAVPATGRERWRLVEHIAVVDATGEAVDRLRAAAVGMSPAATLLVPYEAGITGARSFLPLQRLTVSLATVSAAIAAAGVLVAGLDGALDRSGQLQPLRAAGAPKRYLRGSQVLIVAVPAALGLTLAALMGLVAAYGWINMRGGGRVPVGEILILYGCALATSTLVAVASTAGLGRRTAAVVRPQD